MSDEEYAYEEFDPTKKDGIYGFEVMFSRENRLVQWGGAEYAIPIEATRVNGLYIYGEFMIEATDYEFTNENGLTTINFIVAPDDV